MALSTKINLRFLQKYFLDYAAGTVNKNTRITYAKDLKTIVDAFNTHTDNTFLAENQFPELLNKTDGSGETNTSYTYEQLLNLPYGSYTIRSEELAERIALPNLVLPIVLTVYSNQVEYQSVPTELPTSDDSIFPEPTSSNGIYKENEVFGVADGLYQVKRPEVITGLALPDGFDLQTLKISTVGVVKTLLVAGYFGNDLLSFYNFAITNSETLFDTTKWEATVGDFETTKTTILIVATKDEWYHLVLSNAPTWAKNIETEITFGDWRTGLRGDKGDTGIQGIQGIQGVKGDQGIQGIQGVKGDQGIQGIQGVKGDQGETGPAGSGEGVGEQDPRVQTNAEAIADNKVTIQSINIRKTDELTTKTPLEEGGNTVAIALTKHESDIKTLQENEVVVDPFETVDQTEYRGRFDYKDFEQYSDLEWLPLTFINQIQGDLYYGNGFIRLEIDESSHLLPEHFDLETGKINITKENIGALAHKLYGFQLGKSGLTFVNKVPDEVELAWARWPTTQENWSGTLVSEIEGFELLFPLTLEERYQDDTQKNYDLSSDQQEFEFEVGYTYMLVIKNVPWNLISRRARGDGYLTYLILLTNVNDFSDQPKTSDVRTVDNPLGNTQAKVNKALIEKTSHLYDSGELESTHVKYGIGNARTDVGSALDGIKLNIKNLPVPSDGRDGIDGKLTQEQQNQIQNLDNEGKLDYLNVKNHPVPSDGRDGIDGQLTQEQQNQIQNLDQQGQIDYSNVKNHPAIGTGTGVNVDPFDEVDQTEYRGRFHYNNFEQYSTLEWLPLTTINQIQGDLYYGTGNDSLIIDPNSHLLPEHFDTDTGRIIITQENLGALAYNLYGFQPNKSPLWVHNQVPDDIEIAWARWPTTQGTWIGSPVSEIAGFELLFPLTVEAGFGSNDTLLYGVSSDQEFEFEAGYTYMLVIKNTPWNDISQAQGDGYLDWRITLTNVNDLSYPTKTSDVRTVDNNPFGKTQDLVNKKLIDRTKTISYDSENKSTRIRQDDKVIVVAPHTIRIVSFSDFSNIFLEDERIGIIKCNQNGEEISKIELGNEGDILHYSTKFDKNDKNYTLVNGLNTRAWDTGLRVKGTDQITYQVVCKLSNSVLMLSTGEALAKRK